MTIETDFASSRSDADWLDVGVAICRLHHFSEGSLMRLSSGDHVVFEVNGGRILKIYHEDRNCLDREKKALAFVSGRLHFATPEVLAAGTVDGFDYLVISKIVGEALSRREFLALPHHARNCIIDDLAAGCREIHAIDSSSLVNDWPEFVKWQAEAFIGLQIGHGVNRQVIDALPEFIERNLRNVPLDRSTFLHGDIHFGNLRFAGAGRGECSSIAGMFDFADSRVGFFEYDFAAIGILMIQGERELQRRFFLEYGYVESDLDEQMRDRLMMLTMLYETADLRRYAIRRAPEAVDYSLERLTREIWSFV